MHRSNIMRSYLTRPVFRCILDGSPLTHHGCLYRRYHFVRTRRTAIPNGRASLPQQRTLFNSFFRLPVADKKKEQDVYPGLKTLQSLSRAEMLDSRRPGEEKLRDAMRQFCEEKKRRGEVLDEVAAGHVLRSLSWLKRRSQSVNKPAEEPEEPQTPSPIQPWLDQRDARTGVELLVLTPANEATKTHQDLALLLQDALVPALDERTLGALSEQDFVNVVRMLSVVGKPVQARELLADLQKTTSPLSTPAAHRAFIQILGVLDVHDFSEQDLKTIRQLMAESNVRLTSAIRAKLVRYNARKDKLREAIQQLEEPVTESDHDADRSSIVAILESCIRLKDEQVGRSFLAKHLEDHSDSLQMWTCVFKFASAVGRGPDEVDRMMTVMESRAAEGSKAPLTLNIRMLNDLVEFAVDRKDSYLAERFISLGQKRGVQPNGLTFIYQMKYRLSIDDVDGAIAAYEQARGLTEQEEEIINDNISVQEVAAMNGLVQAMCNVERRYSHQDIMRVVDDLNRKPRASFHAATVARITVLHLRREEYHDVVDLLKSHTTNYSVADRRIVRDAMVAYCFDLRNSTARVWDCYQIFRQLFDAETPRDIRTSIMKEFYRRRRADMGYYVFSHMRDSPNAAVRANRNTYVDALLGIARCKDEETLEFVHNQLKLDPNLDLDTRLSNALMLAYIGIGHSRRALACWDDIMSSREGPSYNSILIALRACEESPFGIEQGNNIWDKLMALDIEVTKEVYTAWCACLAGTGFLKELNAMLQRAQEFGITLDTWMYVYCLLPSCCIKLTYCRLGSIFNAAGQHPHAQSILFGTLKQDYPEIAEKLLAMPHRRERNGARRLKNIDRTLQP